MQPAWREVQEDGVGLSKHVEGLELSPRCTRIYGSWNFVSLNSRLESDKEEKKITEKARRSTLPRREHRSVFRSIALGIADWGIVNRRK